MSRIFYNVSASIVGGFFDGRHIAGESREMHRHDGAYFRMFFQGLGETIRTYIDGSGIDVGKQGSAACIEGGIGAGRD